MNTTSRFLIIIAFFGLLGAGMFMFSKGLIIPSIVFIVLSIALLTYAVMKFDKSRQALKLKLISFANSKNIKPEYIFLDVNLVKAVGIDKVNQKVVTFENNKFTVEELADFSGAEIEKSNNSNVAFYRKSESNPVLKIKIRNGQFQDYSSYIQTVFQ
ncbi:hypothetical protein ABK814_18350 [Enterobacter hormaechei]|uniref:hypothetical protein n=1 Tax=Enterobacteriaceae TaxID=543 RepID=UPI00079A8728|nr:MULTISPECIES: hypothetical protein [Enterobacteriaceae]MDE4745140.1 hypothetical protein [Klebsiella pneumoniae]SAE40432.1 Uncharacterised protein [Enterobacter hormaechei]SAI44607.1 Uncharacterised protein [Enterobacter hormaechei]